MEMSGLLSLLNSGFTIIPIFNIEFPFHIAYDIIIRLASSWILEDSAGEIAGFFNSAFGTAIQYMYDLDQPFMKMCLDMWSSTTKFALALLPLMLLLSIFSTVKYGGERSSLTLVKTRDLYKGSCHIYRAGQADAGNFRNNGDYKLLGNRRADFSSLNDHASGWIIGSAACSADVSTSFPDSGAVHFNRARLSLDAYWDSASFRYLSCLFRSFGLRGVRLDPGQLDKNFYRIHPDARF